MNNLRRSFWAFWSEPADSSPLVFLRMSIAILGLVQLLILWPYLLPLYGNFGLVQWVISEAGVSTLLPTLGKLSLFTARFGLSSAATVKLVFIIYALALGGLLTGLRPRIFAAIALLAHTTTINNGLTSLYGVDTVLHVSLFYLAFVPSHRGARSTGVTIGLRLLQLHLCLLYLNTGLAKASGVQWWTGEALWRALMQPEFGVFDYSWLANVPVLLQVACWGVIVLEAAYPIGVWIPKLRSPWILGIVLMHAGIAVSMGLWLFSLAMIALNLAAFGKLSRQKSPRQLADLVLPVVDDLNTHTHDPRDLVRR